MVGTNNSAPASERVELDADWWRRINGPTADARGLPNHYYWSEDIFELERARLFARTWCFAGKASDMPRAGDAKPVELAGHPLLLVRDADDRINVFHNVCPHRGARLMTEPCSNRKRIVCPYHAWTYALDGTLKTRPHFHGHGHHDDVGSTDEDPISLFPVRSYTWFDWVFVNLDGEAPAFEKHMRPVLSKLDDFPLSAFRCHASMRFEFNANWKLVAENFFDVYHVFKVHPDLNRIYGGPRTSNHPDGVLMFNEYTAVDNGRGGGLPEPTDLPANWAQRVFFSNVYPNLGIAAYPSNVYLVEFEPLSPSRTAMIMHIYFVGGEDVSADVAAGRQKVLDWWRELNAEDESVCELLQLGRQSAAYPGGRLAPHWDVATQYFARMVAEALDPEHENRHGHN